MNESAEIRGFILNACYRTYPHGCSDELLLKMLVENQFDVSPALVLGHLQYLEEKGYLRVEEIRTRHYFRRVAYITPKGIDLIDGNIPEEPGIMLLEPRE